MSASGHSGPVTADAVGNAREGRQLGRQLAFGSLWMLAMRWSIKVIGLVSTLVLARLLTPDDFGLVAKAMVLVGVIECLNDSGQRLAIIRMERPTQEHYNSAWTIQVLLGFAAGLLIFLCAPLTAGYFDSADAVLVAQALALRPVITGFENIGTVDFRRNLNFGSEFRYGVITKVASFCVTMALAFSLRSYWALVGGIIGGQIIFVLLSYLMHPYRPHISFCRVRELWSFSIWTLASSFILRLQERFDQFLVAGIAKTATMGHYAIGTEIGRLPAAEVILPTTRAIYPVFAKASRDLPTLRALYLRVQAIVVFAISAMSIGIALVAEDLVLVALGERWVAATPYLIFGALAAGVATINQIVIPLVNAVGDARSTAVQMLIRFCFVAPLLFLGLKLDGILGVIQAALVAELLLMPTFFRHAKRILSLSLWELTEPCWRSILATAVMAGALAWLPVTQGIELPVVRLFVQVAYGAATYLGFSLVMWLIAGRPDGAEAAIIAAIRRKPVLA